MKLIVCILPLFCGLALAQFGGFGKFGSNIANTFQQGINTIAARVKNVPLVNEAKNFADFAVSFKINFLFTFKTKVIRNFLNFLYFSNKLVELISMLLIKLYVKVYSMLANSW